MPPEGRSPVDPAEWLRRARSNLARAKHTGGVPEVLYEDLCFDAQQAAEKAIKAILVARQIEFPRTHALADLLTLVERAGYDVRGEVAWRLYRVTFMDPKLQFDRDELAAVCRRHGVRLVVLFGSRATGSPPPGPESDLDIAVLIPKKDDRPGFWQLLEDLSAVFPTESLDLVILGSIDPLFRWEIMQAGVRLWGDPDEHLEFRAFAFRDFVDSADLRALERTLFAKKMSYLRHQLHAAA